MPLDPYASCPCGSGKKFKWCCQPIHAEITRAFELDAEGQHEAAVRAMDEIIKQHADNPEAWGRKAQLLFQMGRAEEAENALQKSLDLNPQYPFGHYLRGRFRHDEGELPGALILFRKAANLYDPQAAPILGQIHALIADCEMKLNHPVAARAALQIAQRHQPTQTEIQEGIDVLFGETARLPLSARREYRFAVPAQRAPQLAGRPLAGAETGKLADVQRDFEQLAADIERQREQAPSAELDAEAAAAWYNLALTRAWQGDNHGALEALDRYVGLETDEQRAAAAWTLAEVLRCGQGLEDQADYVEVSLTAQIHDPQAFFEVLSAFEKERLLFAAQVREQEGILTALLLEKPAAFTAESAAQKPFTLGAYLLLAGPMLRLWNIDHSALERTFEAVQQRAGAALGPAQRSRGPAHFADTLAEAMAFPLTATSSEEVQQRQIEHMQNFAEEKWVHRPLRSLGGVAPIDAAGHPTLRKKLLGAIQFLQECAALGGHPYDFDRLRRKLGLVEAKPEAAEPAGTLDIAALSVAELAGLRAEDLSQAQAAEAFQAAVKLDARDLAGKFAENLVQRPHAVDHGDRFSWYKHLVQQALDQGDSQAALNYLNDGERHDCEHNEGKRRSDYELRRGQILAKQGDFDQAQDVFDRLIAREPAELRFAGSAAEAMLSARQGGRARKYAEQGLAGARQQNKRDSEDYFKELAAAADRQGS